MTAWSIAPWLIALLVALGLGVFGRFNDFRGKRGHVDDPADADQGSYPDDN
jgi:hypothetical protein